MLPWKKKLLHPRSTPRALGVWFSFNHVKLSEKNTKPSISPRSAILIYFKGAWTGF
jgi:hypothetical protein